MMRIKFVNDAMIQARSALRTALGDKPEDLTDPVRNQVIERRIELLTEAIKELNNE